MIDPQEKQVLLELKKRQTKQSLPRRRVVVTGLGVVTPLGNTVAESWQNILDGKSGIAGIEHIATEGLSVRFCGAVKGFDASVAVDRKEARKMDEFIQYALVAAAGAIEDAGLVVQDSRAHRYGVAIGSGIGGLTSIEQNCDTLFKNGPRRISPFFTPSAIINMAAGWVSMKHNLQGPNFAPATACASGTHAIGLAARSVAWGDADVMVAGGAEKASCALGMAGFAAARALSTQNDRPQQASRPWDKDRDGFVLGDGSGILVLEEYEHAKARNARIYAELSGFGMSGDAFHMTLPPEDGRGAAHAMQAALDDAGVEPDEVDHINAHGTSTPAGDIAETKALKTVFGEHAYQLAISSTKSMTGHLLGAAGAVEAVFSVKALVDNMVPPTINLDCPDDDCDLDYVPHKARARPIRHVLSNSFGFGGTNATLVFSRLTDD